MSSTQFMPVYCNGLLEMFQSWQFYVFETPLRGIPDVTAKIEVSPLCTTKYQSPFHCGHPLYPVPVLQSLVQPRWFQ